VRTISGSSTRAVEAAMEGILTTVAHGLGAPQQQGEPKQQVEAA
jgi:hypothetical protein